MPLFKIAGQVDSNLLARERLRSRGNKLFLEVALCN